MISIIIPVYNAEKTIERCVESVEANVFKEIEVILIDDCSKDNSWELCKKLADRYENIKCIRNEENKGVSYTRNQGIKIASQEYTMFIDSDDWIEKNYFSEFMSVIEAKKHALVICGYVNHDETVNGTTSTTKWDESIEVMRCDVKTVIQSLYDSNLLQQLWNKIFDTSLIREKNIWFDEKISLGEDTRFILEYIKKCKIENIYLLNKPLYHYIRGQAGSLMYRVGYESIEEPLKNLQMLYEILEFGQAEIDSLLQADRRNQIELYAYLIFHNSGMKIREKKRLIYKLDEKQGKYLYEKNQKLYCKEKIVLLLKKLGIGKKNE